MKKTCLLLLMVTLIFILVSFSAYAENEGLGVQHGIDTNAGTFYVTIDNIHVIKGDETADNLTSQKGADTIMIAVQAVIENENFVGFYNENYLYSSDVPDYFDVIDAEGFSLEFYPYSIVDGKYESPYAQVNTGTKKRISFPYYASKGTENVTVRFKDGSAVTAELTEAVYPSDTQASESVADIQAAADEATAAKAELENQITEQSEKLAAAETAKDEAVAAKAELESKVAELDEKLAAAETAKDEAVAAKAELESKVAELESQLSEAVNAPALIDLNALISKLADTTDEELEAVRVAIVKEQKNRMVTKLLFDKDEITLVKGKTDKITHSVIDIEEGVKVEKTTWTSSDAAVATVQNGAVRAVNGGNATITCVATLSDGTELDAECRVTVVVVASGITITPNNITLDMGTTQKLAPVIKPDNVTSSALTYSSDNPDIVSVDSDGNIKAVHGGKAVITISTTDGSNKAAKATVFVPSVSAAKTEYTITDKRGDEFTIKYYGMESNLSVVAGNKTYADVSYSLSGQDLTIVVIPKAAGAVGITVSDKSDVKSKVALKVKIEHSAVYDQQSYPVIKYTEAFRYPSDYEGKNVSFSGRVLQVADGWGYTILRVSSKGRYDNVVYVTIDDDDITTPILEDDNVTVYGTYDGNYTYETIMGGSVTIPSVDAERINVR